MTDAAARFLRGLGRYLAQRDLYQPGHPAVQRADAEVYRRLGALAEEAGATAISLFSEEVVVGADPVPELSGWVWSRRLAEAGIQRLEVAPTPDREEWEAFADALAERVLGDPPETEEEAGRQWAHLQYGPLAVADRSSAGAEEADEEPSGWDAEAEMAEWIFDALRKRGRLPVLQVLTLVESAAAGVAVPGPERAEMPAVVSGEADEAIHGLRVAVLSLRLAASVGGSPPGSLAVGAAGLLHDVGRVLPGTEDEEASGTGTAGSGGSFHHGVAGCRFLLEADERFATAAVVGLEHHRWRDGSGGPDLGYDGAPCRATGLVQVADRWETHLARGDRESAARELAGEAGGRLDPELVDVFLREVVAADSAGTTTSGEPGEGEGPTEA